MSGAESGELACKCIGIRYRCKAGEIAAHISGRALVHPRPIRDHRYVEGEGLVRLSPRHYPVGKERSERATD